MSSPLYNALRQRLTSRVVSDDPKKPDNPELAWMDKSFNKAEVFVSTNVTEYYFAGTDQEYWHLDRDFPNLAPVFDSFWIETKHPTHIRSTVHGVTPWHDVGKEYSMLKKPVRWGAWFVNINTTSYLQWMMEQDGLPADVNDKLWMISITLFTQLENEAPEPLWHFVLVINKETGQAVRNPKPIHPGLDDYSFISAPLSGYKDSIAAIKLTGDEAIDITDPETGRSLHVTMEGAFASEALGLLKPLMLALSFMHCRNVVREANYPSPKLNKKRLARNLPPIYKFHTLHIEPMKRIIQQAADSYRGARGASGITMALHKVRGHFKCVDSRTECLTTKGWKDCYELQVGDTAAQFDMSTQRISWASVEDIALYAVKNQPMVVVSNRDTEMVLTPNHRCVAYERYRADRDVAGLRFSRPPEFILAENLRAHHVIPVGGQWNFQGYDEVNPSWAELLGWYVAEGTECRQSSAVEIAQSWSANPEKVLRIEGLLRELEIEWKSSRAITDRGEMVNFRLTGFGAHRLRELAPRKRLSWRTMLWELESIQALLNGLIDGDGHRADQGRYVFVQKHKRTCDLVQALILRTGRSATVGQPNLWRVYSTSRIRRGLRGTNGSGSKPTVELYDGVVWCPKMPAGTWVARRNGRVFITGNTYTPERPLLGHHVGTWFWGPETRGSKKRGVVVKDYEIKGSR